MDYKLQVIMRLFDQTVFTRWIKESDFGHNSWLLLYYLYIYMQSRNQWALPVITTMALWQFMHLVTWCTVSIKPYIIRRLLFIAFSLNKLCFFFLSAAPVSLFEGSSARLRSDEGLEGPKCSNYYLSCESCISLVVTVIDQGSA